MGGHAFPGVSLIYSEDYDKLLTKITNVLKSEGIFSELVGSAAAQYDSNFKKYPYINDMDILIDYSDLVILMNHESNGGFIWKYSDKPETNLAKCFSNVLKVHGIDNKIIGRKIHSIVEVNGKYFQVDFFLTDNFSWSSEYYLDDASSKYKSGHRNCLLRNWVSYQIDDSQKPIITRDYYSDHGIFKLYQIIDETKDSKKTLYSKLRLREWDYIVLFLHTKFSKFGMYNFEETLESFKTSYIPKKVREEILINTRKEMEESGLIVPEEMLS